MPVIKLTKYAKLSPFHYRNCSIYFTTAAWSLYQCKKGPYAQYTDKFHRNISHRCFKADNIVFAYTEISQIQIQQFKSNHTEGAYSTRLW